MTGQTLYILLLFSLILSFPYLLNATFETREYLLQRMKENNACTLAAQNGYVSKSILFL